MAVILASACLAGGCSTLNFDDAEPEKFSHMDCQALNMLAESHRNDAQDYIFADASDLERRNEGNRNLGIQTHRTPHELERERDRRSIALARRQKGCG